jgi:UDP-N-acetylmuramyl pentapeptide phosphotransferase/UDP-N-acetylglucosamine-1-phosphate transferase
MPAMSPLSTALLGAGLSLVAVGVAAHRGRRRGGLDLPAGHKSHVTPTPRTGGLGLAAAAFAAALPALGEAGLAAASAYTLPALGFLLLGWWDDRCDLSPAVKAVGQVGLALLAVLLGLRWQGGAGAGLPALEFGALTPLMSALWIVAVTTVVNFLDGIDLITAASTSVLLALAAGAGAGPGAGAFYAAFLGATLGFAFWNVTPARTFVGDGGTHLLGFVLAATAMHVPGASAPGVALPWPAVGGALLVGVVDVAAGLVAKARRGVSLTAAHRDHPYQRLTRRGFSHAAVALRYGALALLAAWATGPGAERFGAPAMLALGALVLGANLLEAARAPRAPDSFFVGAQGRGGEHR